MNVSRRSRFGCVHVSVRVKPDQPQGLLTFAVVAGRAGKRSHGNRVIPAEYDRKLIALKYPFNFARELLTRVANLANILQLLMLFGKYVWAFQAHVAEITNGVAEMCDALGQTSNAQCGRTNVHSGHARAIAQRNSQNRCCLFKFRAHVESCGRGVIEVLSAWLPLFKLRPDA